jgi:two-component system, cell cycle sensor histidine kinase and response regulator CckA
VGGRFEDQLVTLAILLGLSIVVQIAAATVAALQIRWTRRKLGWALLCAGFVLMAARRLVTLTTVLAGDLQSQQLAAVQEVVGLVTSLLMLAGVLAMGVLFRDAHANHDALRDMGRRYGLILNAAGEGILGTDRRGVVMFANPMATGILGFSTEEIVGRKLHELVHHTRPDGTPFPADDCPILRTLLRGDAISRGEDLYWRKDGTAVPVEYVATPIAEAGAMTGAVLAFKDISKRRRAEEASDRLIRFMRATSAVASALLAEHDPTQTAQTAVTELGQAAGVSRCYWFDRYPTEDGRGFLRMRAEWCAPNVQGRLDDPRMQRVPEDLAPVWTTAITSGMTVAALLSEADPAERAVMERNGIRSMLLIPLQVGARVTGLIGFDDCTSEMSWPEDAQHLLGIGARSFALALDRWERIRQRDRLAEVVEQATEGVLIADRDGKVVYANQAQCRMSGYSPEVLLGLTLDTLHLDEPDAEEACPYPEVMREGRPWSGKVRCRTAAGGTMVCQTTLFPLRGGDTAPVGVAALLLDTTEQQRLEEQLRRIQKLDALGQFASGIAHDFSNLVMVIASAAALAQSRLAPDHPVQDELGSVLRAADRGAALAKGLLSFARPRPAHTEVVEVNQLVGEMMPLLRRVVPESISLGFDPHPDAGSVKVDRGQIDQVIMNLCLNARDAMPAGGTLSLATGTVVRDVPEDNGRQRGLVSLTVSDTGTGMDQATLKRLFEPFFTTKRPGAGSGLGLATAYAIVKEHGGFVDVTSEPGRGSAFTVLLPAARGEAAPGPQALTPALVGGTEAVLLVEDNDDLRLLILQMLASLGYSVTELRDGQQALEHILSGTALDLVVSDVVMPNMSGVELYHKARERSPSLRFLLTSGYSEATLEEVGSGDPLLCFLRKPYSLSELAARVRQLLDTRTEPAR